MTVTFYLGMSAKGSNGDNPPWFGRCWGFWFPRLRWNSGRPWRKECCDVTAQWLCFWLGFTLWPSHSNTPDQARLASSGAGVFGRR